MRNVFFFLLMLNVGYFAYAAYRDVRSASVLEFPAPQPPSKGVSAIVLTKEVARDLERVRQLNQVVNNPIYGESSDNAQCSALGPMPDLFAGQALVESLKARAFDVVLRAVDKPSGENDYRVLIPPAKTLQDAFRVLRILKSSEIDSYVITQGPDALGISMGLFSTRAAAEIARQGFVDEGYETRIREIPRIDREYWVFAPQSTSTLVLDSSLWAAILVDFPAIQQKMQVCSKNNSIDV